MLVASLSFAKKIVLLLYM